MTIPTRLEPSESRWLINTMNTQMKLISPSEASTRISVIQSLWNLHSSSIPIRQYGRRSPTSENRSSRAGWISITYIHNITTKRDINDRIFNKAVSNSLTNLASTRGASILRKITWVETLRSNHHFAKFLNEKRKHQELKRNVSKK